MEIEGMSMAEKMDKKKPARTLWPVFFNTVIVVTVSLGFAVVAYTFITPYASRVSSWLLTRAAKMMDAEGSLASALMTGMIWGGKTQVAARVLLLLLLPCHRWRRVRRAATYAALAVTIASCCMYVGAVLVADPGGHFLIHLGNAAIFIGSVVNLLVILALFGGGEG